MPMIHDRQITIFSAGSRWAEIWQGQTLHWSELVARLATPVRSTETLMEYLRLPKSKQDKLKDVGGFVGGSLAGGRRKAGSVTGRDIITLDFDNIPAMATQDILKRLDSLGVGFAVYSTRKHEPARPRLRIIFPVSRTVTADEYEPIARKLAEFIAIQYADPTTFQPTRLMYWPSTCAGAEYIYHYADKPMVDADGLLGLYADWRDVTQWPRVPGAQDAEKRQAEKQEDPTNKQGLVGIFCRTYNIYQAMDTFLPGAYEPAEGSDDRYSFVGGSTTGGAVIYENGTYLFSHHATDPASSRLVNSFDLVRLHKFSALDDDAKEGTPTVKLPSYLEMLKLVQTDPVTAPIVQRERGEKILADFGEPVEGQEAAQSDEQLTEFLGRLKGAYLTTNMVRSLTNALGLSIKLNILTGGVDMAGTPKKWSRENTENNLPRLLLDILKPAEVKGAEKNAVCDCLDVIADENRHNPIVELLQNAQWDGEDRLPQIYAMLGITKSLDQLLVRKWLHQCVALAFNDELCPWGADGVLALSGPQGIGKTSFFKMLCPYPDLMREGATLDPKEKDTIIHALGHWITELGELDRTTAKDHIFLKAFITNAVDEYRTPYARKAIKRVRRTSLCGTVNTDDFLMDDSGNRRFWVVSVSNIDLNFLFSRDLEWKTQLWAQMYEEFKHEPMGFRLTGAEREELESRNKNYTKPLDYELEVRSLFEWGLHEIDWVELTSTEVAARISPRPPANRIGRVLSKIAKSDSRIRARFVDGVNRYLLPVRKIPGF